MLKAQCPACGSTKASIIERFNPELLISLYKKAVNVDVKPYFQGVSVIAFQQCLDCDLRYFSPPCAGNAAFYEQLQNFDWYYQEIKPEYEFSRKLVLPNNNVLEVGCGKGAFQSFLHDSVQYTGLEFNDEAVRKARSRGLNVIKKSIQECVTTCSDQYDVVCSFQVLEHIPEVESFFNACVKAVKPGGKLIIAVPSEDSFLGIAKNSYLNMPPHHVTRWTDLSLKNMAQRSRLSVVEMWHEPVASYHESWHANVLARQYFTKLGPKKSSELFEAGLMDKVIRRVLHQKFIRNFLASNVAKNYPTSDFGHTVVLVASK